MSDIQADKAKIVHCIRMLEYNGIVDYNGHASIRVGDGRMLINTGSCQRSRLTVDDICMIDFGGNLIEGNGKATTRIPSPRWRLQGSAGCSRCNPCSSKLVNYPVYGGC